MLTHSGPAPAAQARVGPRAATTCSIGIFAQGLQTICVSLCVCLCVCTCVDAHVRIDALINATKGHANQHCVQEPTSSYEMWNGLNYAKGHPSKILPATHFVTDDVNDTDDGVCLRSLPLARPLPLCSLLSAILHMLADTRMHSDCGFGRSDFAAGNQRNLQSILMRHKCTSTQCHSLAFGTLDSCPPPLLTDSLRQQPQQQHRPNRLSFALDSWRTGMLLAADS